MDIVFKHGPWNTFFEGQSSQHKIQLLSDEHSTILSLVWDIQGKETVGLVLEWLRVLIANKNPGLLIEKTGFDCFEIAKKEEEKTYWFVLVRSPPSYVRLEQKKIDEEMENAYFMVHGNEKKLLALGKTLNIELQKLEDCGKETKSAFFGSGLIYQTLAHKIVQEKEQSKKPHEFVTQKMFFQGEFLLGADKQQRLIKEPFGLFRRSLIVDGTPADRLQATQIMLESALLSGIAVIVFDASQRFDGLQNPNPNRKQLEKAGITLEAIGFPTTHFSLPEKVRINISMLDIEAVLELFRAGKTPAIQTVQKLLSSRQASSLTQLVEAIKVQSPVGTVTDYQLKKAIRIALLIEKAYPGFFDGPNDIPSLAKSWGGGLGRAGLIQLDGLDERIKIILLHALLRELIQHFKKVKEQRPIKAMIFLPEAAYLFPRHPKWKIHTIIAADLQEASSYGIGSVISTEKSVELFSQLVSGSQSQISIVNQDDIAVRIEHRKPYRVRLRPSLSACIAPEKPLSKTILSKQAETSVSKPKSKNKKNS